MKARLKVAVSAAVILISLGVLSRFFDWMNRPNDAWLYAGLLGALSLLVLVPAVLGAIWGDGMVKHKRS
jgi:hypothetical protein